MHCIRAGDRVRVLNELPERALHRAACAARVVVLAVAGERIGDDVEAEAEVHAGRVRGASTHERPVLEAGDGARRQCVRGRPCGRLRAAVERSRRGSERIARAVPVGRARRRVRLLRPNVGDTVARVEPGGRRNCLRVDQDSIVDRGTQSDERVVTVHVGRGRADHYRCAREVLPELNRHTRRTLSANLGDVGVPVHVLVDGARDRPADRCDHLASGGELGAVRESGVGRVRARRGCRHVFAHSDRGHQRYVERRIDAARRGRDVHVAEVALSLAHVRRIGEELDAEVPAWPAIERARDANRAAVRDRARERRIVLQIVRA